MLCFRRSLSLSCARASTNVLFLFFGLKALEYAWIYSFRARRREERRELTFASGASLSRGGRVFSLLFFFYALKMQSLFVFRRQLLHTPPARSFSEKKTEPKCASVETRANEKNETRRRRTSRRTFFCAKKKSSSWKETSFARAVFVHAFSMERTFPYRKKIFILAGEKE